jgi:hypothetical protein
VRALAQTTYMGCNQQRLRDLLAEREGIEFSRATVHRLVEHAVVSRIRGAITRILPLVAPTQATNRALLVSALLAKRRSCLSELARG